MISEQQYHQPQESSKHQPVCIQVFRGSIAGAIAKTSVYPLDRLKMIYQVKGSIKGHFHLRSFLFEFYRLAQKEGIVSLWKGNLAAIIRTFPHSGITFFCFDQYSAVLANLFPNHRSSTRLIAGGCAGTTSIFLTYPLDVWNTRLAVSYGSFRYSQVSFIEIEGLSSLYRGFLPTLLGIFPYAGVSFYTFETLKERLLLYRMRSPYSSTNKDDHQYMLSTLETGFCGGLAGIVSQTATYPLDTIRKCMQANSFLHFYKESGHYTKHPRPTIFQTIQFIKSNLGIRGFYSGVTLNWLKGNEPLVEYIYKNATIMTKVLMVAEKPSIAESLTKALSGGRYTYRKSSSPVCGVYEYDGIFMGKPASFKVTSTAGHVFVIDFPSQFNNWDVAKPEELFSANIIRQQASPKARVADMLYQEYNNCDHIVLWLDCDREGENICFEVLDCVTSKDGNQKRKINMTGGPNRQVWRAQFSSLSESDLKRAMQSLVAPNKCEAEAVDCRQELDLKIGCAFTRFQTRFFQGKYGNLDSRLISYGPCQTPTLFFCVQRSDAITSFEPETYYTIDVDVQLHTTLCTLRWTRGRIFDAEVARIFHSTIKEHNVVTVLSITEKRNHRPKPQALNTVLMLRLASTLLGMGPHQTMQTAERLYLSGFITYPRTETSTYPKSFNLISTVQTQTAHSIWGTYARELLSKGLSRPREGVDAGDHPPITPVKCVGPEHLEGDMWKLYALVTRHFLASVSGDCIYLRVKSTFGLGQERFTLVGDTIIEPGFKSLFTSAPYENPFTTKSDNEDDEDNNERYNEPQPTLPQLKEGDTFTPKRIALVEAKTSPPKYLSESDLLGLMEKYGIGTDASMPTHINNILQRNFVELIPNRRLKPTILGTCLVHGYMTIDAELVLPKIRANIESQCTLVAQGKANKDAVLSHSLSIFKEKFLYFSNNIITMNALFEAQFSNLATSGEPFSFCGKCKRYMKLIKTRPKRLYCNNCAISYNLPSVGTIKLYQGLKCPLDDFELILCVQKDGGKNFPLCPLCYNDPPFNPTSNMDCLKCEHPTCKHSLSSQGVCSCPQDKCCGTLCLDAISIQEWKLNCNQCNYQLTFSKVVHRVAVLHGDQCNDCGSNSLNITLHKDRVEKDQALDVKGCLVCNTVINNFLTSSFAKVSKRPNTYMAKKGRGFRKKPVDLKMTFDKF